MKTNRISSKKMFNFISKPLLEQKFKYKGEVFIFEFWNRKGKWNSYSFGKANEKDLYWANRTYLTITTFFEPFSDDAYKIELDTILSEINNIRDKD